MNMPYYSSLTILFSSIGMIVAASMLVLVVWQTRGRPGNLFLAAFMLLIIGWGAGLFGAHLGFYTGFDPVPYFRLASLCIGLSGAPLFAFIAYHYGYWKRPLVRRLTWGGMALGALMGPLLFQGVFVDKFAITADGMVTYHLDSFAYVAFALLYLFHLGTLGILIKQFRLENKSLLAGTAVLVAGTLTNLFAKSLGGYPIGIAAATVCAIIMASHIVRHSLFDPMTNLNAELEHANRRLSDLTKNLRAKEQNLRSLLENTSELIWSLDENYRILTLNTTAADLFALIYAKQFRIGDKFLEHVPIHEQTQWRIWYDKALHGERFTAEKEYRVNEETARTLVPNWTNSVRHLEMEISFNPIFDEEGSIKAASMFARDITERKRSERRQRLQALTYENMNDSVIITNLAGFISNCNPATEHIFGYTEEELIGRPPSRIWLSAAAGGDLSAQIQLAIENQGRWSGEIRFGRKDGREGIADVLVLPLQDENGAPLATLIVSRDVTRSKMFEAEIKEAKEAAEAANRAKSSFLASMSHELRTPLNAIIGYSEMLEEESRERNYTDITLDLRRITTAGRHLLSLINDILDLSKIEAGKINLYLERFLVADLVAEVRDTNESLLQRNGNRFIVEMGPNLGTMHSDVVKIRQILINLLSNAAKFTHNGTITLKAERQATMGGDTIVFSVADTGIGLSPEQSERIFYAFTQADDSTTRQFGGTGLGLTITHRYCQMLKGHIAVQSELGKGATFVVTLPALIDPQAVLNEEETTAVVATGDSTVARGVVEEGVVVVIDDNSEDRDLITRWLYKEGFRVYGAATGMKGIKLAHKLKPDAIILDLILPNMSGWEVLKQIQSDPDLCETPIIITSSLMARDDDPRLESVAFLTKPLDRTNLVALIHGCTAAAKSQKTEQKRVMIVEDNAALRDIMRLMLERDGFKVFQAVDSMVALSQLQDMTPLPDLIIIDLMLPHMDGFELIDELGRMGLTANIPKVVITAKQLSEAEHRRLSNSVAQILYKGFYTQTELLRRISSLIETHIGQAKQSPVKV